MGNRELPLPHSLFATPYSLISDQPLIRRRQHAVFAENKRGCAVGEDVGEGVIADVEAAGVGAESWHHQARAISGEAAAADTAATADDARTGVHVAGDLARRSSVRGFVLQHQ